MKTPLVEYCFGKVARLISTTRDVDFLKIFKDCVNSSSLQTPVSKFTYISHSLYACPLQICITARG